MDNFFENHRKRFVRIPDGSAGKRAGEIGEKTARKNKTICRTSWRNRPVVENSEKPERGQLVPEGHRSPGLSMKKTNRTSFL